MTITSIAVFCGSKPGNKNIYLEHTNRLGTLLAEKKIEIIYGGGNKGLMGAVANAAMQQRGRVTGIIPKFLSAQEHQHQGLHELHVVETMHIRKQMLYEKCQAAIILPGGYGTLDEVFETLTWNQLSLHEKKIFILNSGGFYDHLLAHIHRMQEEGFLYSKTDETLTVLATPDELLLHI